MLYLDTSDHEQGSAAWKNARAGHITGSGFQHVLAKLKDPKKESKARQNYRFQLLTERISGQPIAEINAAPLSWGKEHEEDAKVAYEMYMAEQGQHVFVERVGFVQHKTLDWVGSSPDGLVGEHGIVEVKCPWNSMHHLMTIINASKTLAAALSLSNDMPLVAVPEEHLPQIQGNLWVLERQWADFVSFDPRMPPHLQLYVARVERDEAFIKTLEAEVIKFLEEIENNVTMLLSPL